MKNTFSKYYFALFYLGSTFVMFAQPGTEDDNGNLEDTDPLPIDNYIWVLALIALVFVFMKIRAIQKNRII